MKPSRLRCEYHENPLGIDELRPHLSWQLQQGIPSHFQTAFQIQTASSLQDLERREGALDDSGKVQSPETTGFSYEGTALKSGSRRFWRVRYWDEKDTASEWSDVAWWETGLLKRSDWKGAWIGGPLSGGPQTCVPAPFLRTRFRCDGEIASARLYITALGLYECEINGAQAGDLAFTPGWTDYRKNVAYQVYDVTSQLLPGENVIGVVLGDGWYCGHLAWWGRQLYGTEPKFLAQLLIRMRDGTEQLVTTDRSWRVAHGPILESDILNGESYDARQELTGWSSRGFDDGDWQPARLFPEVDVPCRIKKGPPVRRITELHPVSDPVVAPKSELPSRFNACIFDLGQNITGRVRLKVQAPRGTQIVIRHGEALEKNGALYTANLRSAKATNYYTCRGGGEEIWEPRFTYHGFRYVEVQGLPEPVNRDAVTGIVIHSDMPVTGTFTCSDPLLNQLQSNITWSQRDNMLEVPSDCPQRDERLGWTGDAQVFIRTAAFNRDISGFFAKFQDDMADAQCADGAIPQIAPMSPREFNEGGPAWSDAFLICPWTVYLCYGDTAILERHYPALQRFLDALVGNSIDLIRCHPDSGSWCFGDWLALDGSEGTEGGDGDIRMEPFGRTPFDLIGTAFLAHDAGLMAQVARVLNRPDDVAKYDALFAKVKRAFQQRFIASDGLMAAETQTAYVLALHFDLAPEELRGNMAERLVADIQARGNKLATGFVGTPYLLHVLSAAGHMDTAYEVLFQKTWPSWLYAVTHGATTIWERWDGWTEDRGFQDVWMNSFNHYAYGAVGDWMYQNIGGIDARPAQRQAILRPRPGGGITSASAKLETVNGMISCAWRIEGDVMAIEVVVPSNTTATLHFPEPFAKDATPIALNSGTHSFRNGRPLP